MVGAEQALGEDGLVAAFDQPVGAAPHMRAGQKPVLARHAEVVAADLQRRIVGPEDAGREADAAIVGGETAGAQPADFRHRMRNLGEVLFARLRLRLDGAVAEHGAGAGQEHGVDGGIGMLRGGVVVAPVEHRRGAGIELEQEAHQGADEGVGGRVSRRQPGMEEVEVIGAGPVGADTADRRLPGMDMRLDESGRDDAASGVDRLGAVGFDRRRHGGDAPVLDEDVAARQVADVRIDRNDRAVLDEQSGHVVTLFAAGYADSIGS